MDRGRTVLHRIVLSDPSDGDRAALAEGRCAGSDGVSRSLQDAYTSHVYIFEL